MMYVNQNTKISMSTIKILYQYNYNLSSDWQILNKEKQTKKNEDKSTKINKLIQHNHSDSAAATIKSIFGL